MKNLILICLIAACFASCTSTKNVQRSSTTYDSTYVENIRDSVRVLTAETQRLEQQLKELQFSSVTFDSTQCPDIVFPAGAALLNKDSIQRLVTDLNRALAGMNNKIKVFADGTIEASGRLKQANYTKEKLSRTVYDQQKTIDSLQQTIKDKKAEVKTVTVTKTIQKKTRFLNFWWLFVAGFVLGVVVCKRKEITRWLRR